MYKTLRKTCRNHLWGFNIIACFRLKTMEAPMYWSIMYGRGYELSIQRFYFDIKQKQKSHFSIKIFVNIIYRYAVTTCNRKYY